MSSLFRTITVMRRVPYDSFFADREVEERAAVEHINLALAREVLAELGGGRVVALRLTALHRTTERDALLLERSLLVASPESFTLIQGDKNDD